jgi:hypothetical protein
MSLASLITPFATLAVLGVAGLGLAGLIAPRVPPEAQAALAPLIAATVIFIATPLVLVGVPPSFMAAAVLGPLTLVSIARHRCSIRAARGAALPAILACIAVALYATPAFRHGTWAAATTGNQDAYEWVSQANSLERGPPGGPAGKTPDRIAYDLLSNGAWPTALPGGLAELAAATRVDPVQAYGVFSVAIAAMLALAVFFGARGCLHWSKRRSTIATALVSFNGLILVSSFYGWQAQLLLTTAGTLLILMLPNCFERQSGIRDCIGPSLFAASAIAIYGWTATPFVVVAAAVCAVWSRRRGPDAVSARTFALRLGATVLLSVLLGADGIVRALITLAHGAQHLSPTVLNYWNQYAWASPSDALGFVPRTPRDAADIGWELLAGTIAAVLIVRGLRSAHSSRNLRGKVLLTASLTIFAQLIALVITGSSPYPSLKLMAYSTPLLTLLVLGSQFSRSRIGEASGQAARLRALGTALVNVLAACLFLTTTASALSSGLSQTLPATRVLPVARAADSLPADKVIRISVEDAWDQVWLAYFLRDRPIALDAPSIAFVGYSASEEAHALAFDAPANVVIRERSPGPSIWHDNRFGIYPVRQPASG